MPKKFTKPLLDQSYECNAPAIRFITLGGLVAQQLGCWIWNGKVHGSMPSWCAIK